jgi:dinuclear metal center YbgI/SA1388 family protein
MRLQKKTNSQWIVADIIEFMEDLAPLELAEEWDNCGLQLGSPDWPVRKIWVALDPLPKVVEEAARVHVDLLITHHPLIYKPLVSIDLSTPLGKIIQTAVNKQVAVYSSHTNLDSAAGGVNANLAIIVGLQNAKPMAPFIGGSDTDLDSDTVGLGRIGYLQQSVTVSEIALNLKKCLKLESVRIAGNPDVLVKKAAVCSGSGGSFVELFLQTDAQVFISGDIRYHDARNVEAAGKSLIDIGHFASEWIIVEALVERLKEAAAKKGRKLEISACRLEKEPFGYL